MNLTKLIQLALNEDIPEGDLTTEGLGVGEKVGTCSLIAKQNLILSGAELFEKTFQALDNHCEFQWYFKDGSAVEKGTPVCQIQGNLIAFLKAERVSLNFLGHLSGIATLTHQYVQAAPKIKILDTRKTLPLYRAFEKKAVVDGGGCNHRMNLSDAIMIKENHIAAAGGLEIAFNALKTKYPNRSIEVEVKSLEEVRLAIELGANRLLLDNMDNEMLKKCLSIIPESIETEASGNMNLERLRALNEMPLNFISVGALTHSAPNADFSLLFDWSPTK